jgi:hypothetical protein
VRSLFSGSKLYLRGARDACTNIGAATTVHRAESLILHLDTTLWNDEFQIFEHCGLPS